mmetsp:Transcript_4904/g.20064  ORF Transcript_4904/g.20064 Transcript_4904/m.20064 type:complete len:211 (+) Transcript_4904:470-1102(+)
MRMARPPRHPVFGLPYVLLFLATKVDTPRDFLRAIRSIDGSIARFPRCTLLSLAAPRLFVRLHALRHLDSTPATSFVCVCLPRSSSVRSSASAPRPPCARRIRSPHRTPPVMTPRPQRHRPLSFVATRVGRPWCSFRLLRVSSGFDRGRHAGHRPLCFPVCGVFVGTSPDIVRMSSRARVPRTTAPRRRRRASTSRLVSSSSLSRRCCGS